MVVLSSAAYLEVVLQLGNLVRLVGELVHLEEAKWRPRKTGVGKIFFILRKCDITQSINPTKRPIPRFPILYFSLPLFGSFLFLIIVLFYFSSLFLGAERRARLGHEVPVTVLTRACR